MWRELLRMPERAAKPAHQLKVEGGQPGRHGVHVLQGRAARDGLALGDPRRGQEARAASARMPRRSSSMLAGAAPTARRPRHAVADRDRLVECRHEDEPPPRQAVERHQAADQDRERQAETRQGLRQGDDVGDDAGRLEAEEGAGTAAAGLDVVDDQQRAVLLGDRGDRAHPFG